MWLDFFQQLGFIRNSFLLCKPCLDLPVPPASLRFLLVDRIPDCKFAVLFACLGCLFFPLYGNDHGQLKIAEVTEISSPITLDGVLDESVWASAKKLDDLIQRIPDTGQVVSEKTEVILLRDTDNLYVGVIAYDSEPDKIIGTTMARDASLRSEDTVTIILDTFHDQRNAYYFATNPVGSMSDALIYGSQHFNNDWDAIWDVRTQLTDQGWTAEFSIPFKSLNFPENSDTWGFNIRRNILRKIEESIWSGASVESTFLNVSNAGALTNMTGLKQGIGLDVRPFLATSLLHSKNTGDDDFDFEPGLDVFYNITPSLKLSGTINTDFGETEVDARQINLDRFSLFFPEKRSFFLEDIGVFNFASTVPEGPPGAPDADADIIPFFSRRIGLFRGAEVPIEVGAKLTGRVGQTEIGFLGVMAGETILDSDGDPILVEDTELFVGRVKQNFWEESYVGGIFTHGDPAPGLESKTYGADVMLSTSEFLGYPRNFRLSAFGLKSDNEGVEGEDMAFGAAAHYPNEIWEGILAYSEIEKDFDPSLGFVQRNNVRMYRIGGNYNPRPVDFLNVEDMIHSVYYTRFESLENGQLESSTFDVDWFHWHFKSGDSIHSFMNYNRDEEQLFEPFEISDGVVLPVGRYKMDQFSLFLASARKRPLYASLGVTFGDFWSGSGEQVRASFVYKLPPRFTLDTSIRYTFANLPEGKFTARVFTTNLDFSLSPRLSFSNLVQYDNRSRNLGLQSRIRWTPKPGNDLFLSFNQGWINESMGSLRFVAADTKIATKFQYTYRF